MRQIKCHSSDVTKSVLALITYHRSLRDISDKVCAPAISKLMHNPTEHQIMVRGTWETSWCTAELSFHLLVLYGFTNLYVIVITTNVYQYYYWIFRLTLTATCFDTHLCHLWVKIYVKEMTIAGLTCMIVDRLYLRSNAYFIWIIFLWRCGPTRAMASSFMRFLDHTQRRTTVGRTPLDEWSALRRDLYLTTHNTHNR